MINSHFATTSSFGVRFGKVAILTMTVPVKQLYPVAVDASGSLPGKDGLGCTIPSKQITSYGVGTNLDTVLGDRQRQIRGDLTPSTPTLSSERSLADPKNYELSSSPTRSKHVLTPVHRNGCTRVCARRGDKPIATRRALVTSKPAF